MVREEVAQQLVPIVDQLKSLSAQFNLYTVYAPYTTLASQPLVVTKSEQGHGVRHRRAWTQEKRSELATSSAAGRGDWKVAAAQLGTGRSAVAVKQQYRKLVAEGKVYEAAQAAAVAEAAAATTAAAAAAARAREQAAAERVRTRSCSVEGLPLELSHPCLDDVYYSPISPTYSPGHPRPIDYIPHGPKRHDDLRIRPWEFRRSDSVSSPTSPNFGPSSPTYSPLPPYPGYYPTSPTSSTPSSDLDSAILDAMTDVTLSP